MHSTTLLREQCLLLRSQKGAEEITKANRVLNDAPNIQLCRVKVCQALNGAVPSIFTQAMHQDIQALLPKANSNYLRSIDGHFELIIIIQILCVPPSILCLLHYASKPLLLFLL